jgi:glycosyltransferase involved in cell wall biosynthesis
MEISVLIIVYNKSYELNLVLSALENQSFDHKKFEVVVVDDGSTDDTKKFFDGKKWNLNLRYVRLKHCGIRGKLRNYSKKYCTGKLLLFLDGDMVADPKLLERHWDLIKSDQRLISLGVRKSLVDYDKELITGNTIKNNFEIIEQFPSANDERTLAFEYSKRAGEELKNTWTLFYSHNFCLHKSKFLESGGFDVSFSKFWGAEDIELGYRLHLLGCKIKLNEEAIAYHLFHPVNKAGIIQQLRKNLNIFYQKHNHFEIELFKHEYKIWVPEYFRIREALLKKEHEIKLNSTNGLFKSNASSSLISFGVILPKSNKVDLKIFSPGKNDSDIEVIEKIGIEEKNTRKEKYKIALVSKKYLEVSDSLYSLVLKRAGECAKKVFIIEDENKTIISSNRDKQRDEFNRKVTFMLSPSSAFNSPFKRYYFEMLAKSCENNGAQPSFRFSFEPFEKIDWNSGFFRSSDPNFINAIEKMRTRDYSFLEDMVPCVMDIDVAGGQRCVGQRIWWGELGFQGQEIQLKKRLFDGYNTLMARRKSDEKILGIKKPFFSLPVGVNVKINKKDYVANKVFTILWTMPVTNEVTNLKAMIKAFKFAFSKKDKINLMIFCGKNREILPGTLYVSDSYRNILEKNIEIRSWKLKSYFEECKLLANKDPRISFFSDNYSFEELRSALISCDAFVDTNASKDISPFVLECYASGKRPIVCKTSAYDGYFEKGELIEIESEAVSGVYHEPFGEMVSAGSRSSFRYYSMKYIDEKKLGFKLREIYKNANLIRVNRVAQKRFIEKYNWDVIGKQMVDFLLNKENR